MSDRKFYKRLPDGSFMEMESYEYYGTSGSFPYKAFFCYLGICIAWLLFMIITYLIKC